MAFRTDIETNISNKQIYKLSVYQFIFDAYTNIYCTFFKENTRIYAHFLFIAQISNSNKLRLEVQTKLCRKNCNRPIHEVLAGIECSRKPDKIWLSAIGTLLSRLAI
jgi:hypothetical protein